MAVELLGFSKMDEQMAIQEAATAGLRSMEHFIRVLNHQNQQNQQQVNQLDCRDITDFTVSKFKKVISVLNRTGHARFRRGPSISSSSNFPQSQTLTPLNPTPILNSVPIVHSIQSLSQPQPQSLTLDFTKPNLLNPNSNNTSEASTSHFSKDSFSISPPISTSGSSFMSSITTGDGSVSNGKQGSSLFISPAPTVSAGKPPLSSSYRKKCREHNHSDVSGKHTVSSGGRCHCSKRRKSRVKKTIRVPAISSKMADIPPDEYSWRKYGQKPIKGSPYPRGYYKCSSLKGCSARKHVERAQDDPTMLIVTYEGEHHHQSSSSSQQQQQQQQQQAAADPGVVVNSANLVLESS